MAFYMKYCYQYMDIDEIKFFSVFILKFRMHNDVAGARNQYLTSGLKVITLEHSSRLCEIVYSGKS
jgi:hypothetical protein